MEVVELRQYTLKRRLAAELHQMLSPRTFQLVRAIVQVVRFLWWSVSSYLPRLATALVVKRTPEVRGFAVAGTRSTLAQQLQSVNAFAPTKTCRIMSKYGSDKGRSHNYTTVYSALFKERCDQPLRVFELGLGSNNPQAPSNMGVFGAPGASLRGWRDFFPHALVYGADIDRGILFDEDRIKTFYCDQLDRSSIHELWSHPDFRDGVDIIIEDGLHMFEANVSFLEGSLDHLRPGGIYVTEDIGWNCIDQWCDRIETVYSKRYPTYEFALVILANHGWDNLLVIRRGAN